MNKNGVFTISLTLVKLQFQWRGIAKVRLKWVKNRSLDHIIDKETDLKAASLIKDAIKRSSTGFLTAKSVSDWQKPLGLTVPVLRFMRRYPTLFDEFPHPRWPSVPCFRLTDTALLLDSQEQSIHHNHETATVERLCKLLMMMKTRTMPFQSLIPLKWDLGLPDSFDKTLVPKYPQYFQFAKASNGVPILRLARWSEEFAVSALQKSNESGNGNEYREFKRGQTALVFPMRFPRGYGAQKKVRAWMDEFQKLPYISPYVDSMKIDPNSDLMEKRVVGVLHEFLSLTLHKKTKRNYLRSLRDELNLPHKFTRIFTRYPGIFYLSLKCKTTTVTLREGYRSGKLVDPHPLARHREKFYHVMKTGLLYRGTGAILKPEEEDALLLDAVPNDEIKKDDSEEEEVETSDEFFEDEVSETDETSE
ncbi:protein WHAT'S THIS FACTOR 9, mitochondrial [Gastrolobium bilobum]|uniref:protein WHAT'S THIS FACTOR 9, mitochondrial n=1 Tax=Gastrolobium bilobum TaxID=150636 RepID=UPI002AAFE1ED|nr:protein WHAT'S THIS FACTOR 9, mitochondrial [Gastrolobium bilobum]